MFIVCIHCTVIIIMSCILLFLLFTVVFIVTTTIAHKIVWFYVFCAVVLCCLISDFIERKIVALLLYFGFRDYNNLSVSHNIITNVLISIVRYLIDKRLKWILDLIEEKVQTPDVLISMKNYFSRNPFP